MRTRIPTYRWKEKDIVHATPGMHHLDIPGLYLYVSPDGQVRRYIQRYTNPTTGRPNQTGLGIWPAVTLEHAKAKALANRRLIAQGIDPVQAKRAQRSAGVTFKQAADKYVATLRCSASQIRNNRYWLYVHLKPLHSVPVTGITPQLVRETLAPLLSSDRATRVLGVLKRVLEDHGVHLQLKLRHTVRHGHYTAMPYQQVPALVQRLRAANAAPTAANAALEFLILTLAPTKEVLHINRADVVDGVWNLTRFKTNQPYRIPLSSRALALLDNDWQGLEPKALYRLLLNMGISCTVHGFRSTFMNWGIEQGYDAVLLDLCLGHKVRGVMGHYLRSDALERRRAIMNAWAEFCGSAVKAPALAVLPGYAA